ncbi:MAG: transglycosylase SLT domain-containing protein [Pseudomonadota bacterium]
MEKVVDWRPSARSAAASRGLDPALVEALALTESAGEVFAVRYEPSYQWLFQPARFRPRNSTLETEVVFQKTSWGLMQIMGAVAREHGFRGWLPELCQPEINLEYACRRLEFLLERFGGEAEAVSAYNQGSPRRGPDGSFLNQGYVDRVLGFRAELEKGSAPRK